MKKYIIFAISLIAVALFACCPEPETGESVSGSYVVITDKADTLFASPCGRVWIENPVAAENGGAILSGAAVDSHPFVTVIWANNYREVVMRDPLYLTNSDSAFILSGSALIAAMTSCADDSHLSAHLSS